MQQLGRAMFVGPCDGYAPRRRVFVPVVGVRTVQNVEFVARVRDRGEFANNDEARRVIFVVLQLLGQRLDTEANDLATDLPTGIGEVVVARGIDEVVRSPYASWSADLDGFLERVAMELSETPATARRDAKAVLSTVSEEITGRELDQVLSNLQPAYAQLFGKPDPGLPE